MKDDFQHYFDAIPDPLLILDQELRIVSANSRYCELMGLTASLMERKYFWEIFPDEGLGIVDKLRVSFEIVLREKEVHVLHLLELKGRFWSVSNSPMLDSGQRVKSVVHKLQDVTEWHKASEERTRLLKLISDSVPIHLNYLDKHQTFLFVNQAASEWWGRSEKDFIGKTIQEIMGKEGYAGFNGFVSDVLKGETVTHEFLFESAKGHKSWFLNSYIPDFDSTGEVRGFVAMGIDVGQIKLAEDKFKVLADSMPQIVWTANPDGQVDYYNRIWYEFTGFHLGSTSDIRTQVIHPDDVKNLSGKWAHSLLTGQTFEAEFRLKKASTGQYRWHLSRALAARDDNGRIVKWYGSDTDIHDSKITLENLKLEKDLRDRFVSALSHDLRTPLTAAKMSAQLLLRKVPADPPIQKLIFRISDNMDRADRMIRDLLDASLVDAGSRLPLKLKDCHLNRVVHDVIDEFSSIHGGRFILDAEVDVTGRWDCDGIHRILDNLINNALKYGGPDTPITVTIRKVQGDAEVEVKNMGHPIPEEEQSRLFDLFRRSRSLMRKEQKGWGIGLSLVKGLVEAHGGKIKVSSSEQEGTKFSITLPMEGT